MRRLEEHFHEEKQSRQAPKAGAAGHLSRRASAKATVATQAPAETPVAVIPAPMSKPAAEATERKRRVGTQSAAVIALLERSGGASLEELCKATGWRK